MERPQARGDGRGALTNGGLDLVMASLLDGLVHDGGSDLLVDGGVMMAGLMPSVGRTLSPLSCQDIMSGCDEVLHEFADGSFGSVHFY